MKKEYRYPPLLDERINKETSALYARLLPWMLMMQGVVLLLKLLPDSPLPVWQLDAALLAVGALTAVLWRSIRGLWNARDEVLCELATEADSTACVLMMLFAFLAALCGMLFDSAGFTGYAVSAAPTLLSGGFMLVKTIRNGLYLPDPRRPVDEGRGRSLLRRGVGAVCTAAGIAAALCALTWSEKGALTKEDVLREAFSGVLVVCVDALVSPWISKISQRRADQIVRDAEGAEEDEA